MGIEELIWICGFRIVCEGGLRLGVLGMEGFGWVFGCGAWMAWIGG